MSISHPTFYTFTHIKITPPTPPHILTSDPTLTTLTPPSPPLSSPRPPPHSKGGGEKTCGNTASTSCDGELNLQGEPALCIAAQEAKNKKTNEEDAMMGVAFGRGGAAVKKEQVSH